MTEITIGKTKAIERFKEYAKQTASRQSDLHGYMFQIGLFELDIPGIGRIRVQEALHKNFEMNIFHKVNALEPVPEIEKIRLTETEYNDLKHAFVTRK